MKPHIHAARALASEFAISFIKPIAIVIAVVFIVAIGLSAFLAVQFSPWWWLLAIPFAIPCLVVGGALLLAWALIYLLRPPLTKEQRQAVLELVEKAQGLNEIARTPYPFLAARIILDFLIHRDGRYVQKIIDDSKSLKGEYQAIQKYFVVK